MSILAAVMTLALQPAYINPDDRVINRASELVPWCRAEAEARAIGEGKTIYQWTSSHYSRGNVLHVDGKLRVEGADVVVRCRIAKGARQQYASMDMESP